MITLKKIKKSIDKNFKVFVVGFITAFSIFIFLYGINIVSWSWENNRASMLDSFKVNNISSNIENKFICEEGIFSEKKDEDWFIKYYKSPKEGFYCISSFSPFPSPDIWYKKKVPTNFNFFKIRFKLKNSDDNTDIPSTFIFSVGKDIKILRFYVAEKSFQVVGFEKIDIKDKDQKLVREEPKALIAPIDYDSDIELEVRKMINAKNKITFYFNLRYMSGLTGESIEDSFSYEVDLPDPFLESELSILEFGFGVLGKSCIKPINYRFCY